VTTITTKEATTTGQVTTTTSASGSSGGCPRAGNYLQTCANCLYTTQCAVGSFCCPYMKKCVPTSSTPCYVPIAGCRGCRESTSGYPQSCSSTCSSSDFPNNWVTCNNSGGGATTTTTTTPESGDTQRTGCITASGPGMCNLAWGNDCSSSTKVTFACKISASGRYSQWAGRTFNFGMTAYAGYSKTFTDCDTCTPIHSVEP
jgi:hypothetical protein